MPMKKIMLAVSLIVIFGALGIVGYQGWKFYERQKLEEEHLRRIEDQKEIRQTGDESRFYEEDGKLQIPVDFLELQKENQDIYAWLTIPGVADTPIIQDSEGEEDFAFTEEMNKKDFSDPLTVIYGENKEDGSLFGSLFQYRDKLFMEEHPVIYIYTPDQILIYRIFAAYRNDNRHLLKRFNQGIYEGNIRAFIKDILSQRAMDATIEQDAPIDTNDYFLTLSTHDPAGEEYRYLVQAYLEKSLF